MKDDISEEARNLLTGILERDPAKRMKIGDILNHPWMKDALESDKIELFTEQESQYIQNEYNYKLNNRYDRNGDLQIQGQNSELNQSGLDADNFTEHMLDSTQNSILKNCETKSIILAPFNSTKSNIDCDTPIELSDSIKDLIEDKKIIKFGAKVRDIDKQYEINNNADLDNGVYHKVDDEEEEKQDTESQ